MKISVITRHAVSNYGSLLQTFATQQIIEKLGHSCEIIDYIPRCERPAQVELQALRKKTEWNKNFIKRFIYLCLRQPSAIIAGLCFKKWRRKHLKLTKTYSSFEEIVNNKPVADIYMTGSDQVWGPIGEGVYDKSYMLAFTDKTDKKVSYASSIGRSELSPDARELFDSYLKQYSAITVRESSAVKFFDEIGISASQVLDPTLLLDAEFWRGIATKKRKNKKYILVYQIHNDKRLNEYAKKASKKTKLPLVRISPNLHQIFRGGSYKWLPDLGEFLAYIRDAEVLITDSFHGTAFAINFNVPFVEILAENGTQSRNQDILTLTKLTDRILNDEDDFSLIERAIDYNTVNQIIEINRKESIEKLANILL